MFRNALLLTVCFVLGYIAMTYHSHDGAKWIDRCYDAGHDIGYDAGYSDGYEAGYEVNRMEI